MLKKNKNNNNFDQVNSLSSKIDNVNDINIGKNNESYQYKDNIYKLLNTKAQPNKDDTILQNFIRFLVLYVARGLIGIFATCISLYIIIYTLATIFPYFNWIDIKIMENTMAKFIHHISLLSGWILYLIDKFSKSNGK